MTDCSVEKEKQSVEMYKPHFF